MRQVEFLEFVAAEAGRYPEFKLVMGANVRELVESEGIVRGVRYQAKDGWHEVRALWFRLPKRAGDPEGIVAGLNMGRGLIMLERTDHWQLGYVLPKGTYQQVHAAGLDAFRQTIAAIQPFVAGRVDALQDWKQCSLLAVESDRLPRWYRRGLLLIGDAAHVRSPIGGSDDRSTQPPFGVRRGNLCLD